MKCGICGTEEIEVLRFAGELVRTRPISDSSDLWQHKRLKHSEILNANRQERQTTAANKAEAEWAEKKRRSQLRTDASLPAVTKKQNWNRQGNDVFTYAMTTTAEMRLGAGNPDNPFGLRARYPEPEILSAWQHAQEQIVALQEECEEMCQQAWEAGTFISDADIDAVIAAGE